MMLLGDDKKMTEEIGKALWPAAALQNSCGVVPARPMKRLQHLVYVTMMTRPGGPMGAVVR